MLLAETFTTLTQQERLNRQCIGPSPQPFEEARHRHQAAFRSTGGFVWGTATAVRSGGTNETGRSGRSLSTITQGLAGSSMDCAVRSNVVVGDGVGDGEGAAVVVRVTAARVAWAGGDGADGLHAASVTARPTATVPAAGIRKVRRTAGA